MNNVDNFETLDGVETLQDNFNFKNLPAPAQRAYFADAKPLWPKNKKGKRVRPKRKSRSTSSRTAKRRRAIEKLTSKPKVKKTKSTKKNRKKSSGGLTTGQKLTIAAVGIGIITLAIVKRPG